MVISKARKPHGRDEGAPSEVPRVFHQNRTLSRRAREIKLMWSGHSCVLMIVSRELSKTRGLPKWTET